MKAVVLDGYTLNPGDLSWGTLGSLCQLDLYDRTDPEDILQRIGGAQAVFTNKVPLRRDTLEQCKCLRYIGVLATGYDVVDTAAAKELGITVTNIPTYGTTAVAQYVFALLLELCHHVGHHSQAVHQGRWEHCKDWCFWDYPLIELAGKTMGIIGFGRIGQAVGQLARAFGMKVLAYDAVLSAAPADTEAVLVPLDELLARSDVISLHCPLTAQTRGLICRQSIAKMKPGVLIINTSRGPLVREQDLADALGSGKVAGAGVDVVSTEPIRGGNPLLGAPNCMITPHIAWASKESRQRLMDIAVENLRAFQQGHAQNVVGL